MLCFIVWCCFYGVSVLSLFHLGLYLIPWGFHVHLDYCLDHQAMCFVSVYPVFGVFVVLTMAWMFATVVVLLLFPDFLEPIR